VLVFLQEPTTNHTFVIERVWAGGQHVPPTAWVTDAEPFLPLIDTFGQYRHKDWPGKVHSLEELRGRVEEESRDLERHPAPEAWDRYGGWATGPMLKATGFFRVEKREGRWWLVDPEGRRFFSHGIDCVRMLDRTPVEEREDWFADFPAKQPEFAEFLGTGFALKGHYAGRSPRRVRSFVCPIPPAGHGRQERTERRRSLVPRLFRR
jgi:hypothetical protein